VIYIHLWLLLGLLGFVLSWAYHARFRPSLVRDMNWLSWIFVILVMALAGPIGLLFNLNAWWQKL
jgi:glucan phosphoethanolaminetransferase (alkaline phosphatase superfamily)